MSTNLDFDLFIDFKLMCKIFLRLLGFEEYQFRCFTALFISILLQAPKYGLVVPNTSGHMQTAHHMARVCGLMIQLGTVNTVWFVNWMRERRIIFLCVWVQVSWRTLEVASTLVSSRWAIATAKVCFVFQTGFFLFFLLHCCCTLLRHIDVPRRQCPQWSLWKWPFQERWTLKYLKLKERSLFLRQ